MKIINKSKLVEKYSKNMGERPEMIELNIRGEKPKKIAEWAEAIKWMSIHEPTKSFQQPQAEIEAAYGRGQKGLNYIRIYLVKFGVPHIRVTASADVVHMWSRTPVKPTKEVKNV